MSETEARQKLLTLLEAIDKPDNWKISLDLSQENNVRIIFYKKSSTSFTFHGKTYHFFESWTFVREIEEPTYEDILSKVTKYPKLLETYKEL